MYVTMCILLLCKKYSIKRHDLRGRPQRGVPYIKLKYTVEFITVNLQLITAIIGISVKVLP